MPVEDQQFISAARTVNQFIDLADRDNALKVKNNGDISTRNSIWNKIISYFRGGPTQQENQRTAELFKEKLLAVAGTFEYRSGNTHYHSEDIFYHFNGFSNADRAQVTQDVLNSGILQNELTGNQPLTGRKVREVLAQINQKGVDFANTKRTEILRQVEEGIGLYRETRRQFQEGFFDPQKLEASNLDAFNIAQKDLRNVVFTLDGLITNIRQDLQTAIDSNDVELARFLFGQFKHVSDLRSESLLFNSEAKVYATLSKINAANEKYHSAIHHIDAIMFNFANLTPEQKQAQIDLQRVTLELTEQLGYLGNSIRTATTNLKEGGIYNPEIIKEWEALKELCKNSIAEAKSTIAHSSQASIIKTTTVGGQIKSIEPRSEETHIAPDLIISNDVMDGLEKQIARLEESHIRGGNLGEPKKSALKNNIASGALNQIRQGSHIQFSKTISLSREELDGAKDLRKSVSKNQNPDADLNELDEPGDSFGVYDEASNSIQPDKLSHLAHSKRLKSSDPSKVDKANQELGDYLTFQNTVKAVNQFVSQYSIGSDFIRAYLQEQNIDASKFSPAHEELYQTILYYQTKALATDNKEEFNERGVQKISKRILSHLAKLSEGQIQNSIKRLSELRDAGKAVLASITNGEIKELEGKRQDLGTAITQYVEKVNALEVLDVLVIHKSDELVGGDDRGQAKIAAADIAFSGIKGASLDLLFNDALKADSPLHAAYLAVGAHDKNPAIENNDALNATVLELTQGLNLIIQQIGLSSGLSIATIDKAVGSLVKNFKEGRFEQFANPTQDTPTIAQKIFNSLTPYIEQRAKIIQQRAES